MTEEEWPDWANYAIHDEVGLWAYTSHPLFKISCGGGPEQLRIFGGRVQFRGDASVEPELIGESLVYKRAPKDAGMTEEELEQFVAAAHEFRNSAHYISALNKAEALDELINLVNAMLAKRERE